MTRALQLPTKITLAVVASFMVFGFQNCGQFAVETQKLGEFASIGSSSSAGAVLVPSTDKIDPTCATNPAYDACIVRQNPIATTVSPAPADAAGRISQAAGQSIYGVKLTSLGGSGRLENATLSVRSVDGSQVIANPVNLKVSPALTGPSNFEQVNTYYWMNRAAEYFDARTSGALPAKNKAIKVVVDDTINGYETATRTIRMKRTEAGGAVAWNGDVAVHMFGLANLMVANPNGWITLSATKHLTCSAIDNGCCATATGCANALRFGVGEYFAISMFPDHTRVGEGVVNTGNPQIIAGVLRDVASLKTTTAAQVFNDAAGNAQALGLVYASMWWEVRLAAGADGAEIDRIFLEHLTLIGGSDDLKSGFAKAKSVDARLFGGRHSAQFDAQLTARGL